jgi:uncharacterized membrane protein
MHTVVGTYRNMSEAQKVLTDLVNAGFDRDDISLVTSDAEGRYQNLANRKDVVDDDVTAGEGALIGGLEGGLIGFALGLGALAIPGIGPIVAFGPLLGGLIGAGTGAVTGGLTASLIDSGVAETDAHSYAEAVRRGYVLLSVHAPDERVDEAKSILNRYDVVDIDDRADQWRSQGWKGYDANAKPFTSKDIETEHSSYGSKATTGASITGPTSGTLGLERGAVRTYPTSSSFGTGTSGTTGYGNYSKYADDFRTHYQTNYANNQYSFSNYEPAYQYGTYLASEPRYRSRSWNEIERDVRRDWETRNQGAWEDFKDSIRYAWERAKAAVR